MHQQINNFEPFIIGLCLLSGYDNELYPSTVCDTKEFQDLTIVTNYLRFNLVLKTDVTNIVDSFIRKLYLKGD